MTKRNSLADLIVKKKQPLLTLDLFDSYQNHPDETVETYIFTDSIRHHAEQIFESVSRGAGQGFWVQAEYGTGKTHFLATLAALLSETTDELWSKVSDPDIRRYQKRLMNARLFPVVLSLRGEASADTMSRRSLMDVLLEKGFRPALERAGLKDRIKLTSAEDLMDWYDRKAPAAIKADFESNIQRATRLPFATYRNNEGAEAVAALLSKYLEANSLKPEIAVGVKDRLASIYKQITASGGPGYTGLLVVIDEYEGWSNIRRDNVEARAKDEDLLESLGYLLPKDLGMVVHTIVASQSAVPAKLHGGQEGDRFINLPLLADQNSRDYDIIASRRVRNLNSERLPEIADYYRYYAETFAFARQLSETDFRDTFPFQPRCFEIVRRITSRDLPGPRSGIRILYEVVTDDTLLARDTLIRASDLMNSRHLSEDCFSKPAYKPHYTAYQLALEALGALDLETSDLELAKNILATLYLWYEAFTERPRPMSLQDLAQATLTTGDVVKAEDNVAYVLSKMQTLQQVLFDNQNAQFVPAGDDVPQPLTLFKDFVRRAKIDSYALAATWTNSLFLTAQDTNSLPGLFSEFEIDQPTNRAFEHRNLQYAGNIAIASRWQLDWGMPITGDDAHFRLVIMTAEAAQSVQPADLQDPRLAVIYPAPLTEETQRTAAEYLAWTRMSDEYKDQTGKEAEAIRDWLAAQRRTYLETLIHTQLNLYRSGQIITRDDLGIAAKEAFGAPSNDQRLKFIVDKLLAAAYPQLPIDPGNLRSTLTSAEAGKVFEGYFGKDPSGAQTTATRNYGIGLGLSNIDAPHKFVVQENNKALALIAHLLDERKGSELPVWKLFETLSRPPYGLPYVVIQLYVLSFVYRGDPRVELVLKRDHKLKSRDGKAFPRDRVNAATVTDLQWRPNLYPAFDTLAPAIGPTWSEALRYAREFVDDLRATTDQAEIEAETRRLIERLSALGEELPKQRNALQVLERTLNATLPADAQQMFKQLDTLAQAREGYAAFYEKADELFVSPDNLRDALKTLNRMRELAESAAEIAETKRYLDDVRLREADRELGAQQMTLVNQISLSNLTGQPHTWHGIQAQFDQFKARYRNEYQKHHRNTKDTLKELTESLADAPRRLKALALLNSIQELGPARGPQLMADYERLVASLRPCSIIDFQSVSIEAAPVCAACQRSLTYTPPTDQVAVFLRDLNAALTDQQRSLANETVRRILERGQGDALSQFLQAAQAANIATLVDLLDEDIVTVIRKLLAEEQIGMAEGDVIGRFLQRYGSLEEGDIPAAMKAFEALLRDAFQEAKKANQGKKTIRLTLR